MEDNLDKMRSMIDSLTDAQEQIDTFFEISPDLLVIVDPRGYFIRVNPAWEHILGYTKDELLHRPFLFFVHEEDTVYTLRELERIAQHKTEGIEEFRNRYRAKDGHLVTLDWRSIAKGDFIYAIARVVDSDA